VCSQQQQQQQQPVHGGQHHHQSEDFAWYVHRNVTIRARALTLRLVVLARPSTREQRSLRTRDTSNLAYPLYFVEKVLVRDLRTVAPRQKNDLPTERLPEEGDLRDDVRDRESMRSTGYISSRFIVVSPTSSRSPKNTFL